MSSHLSDTDDTSDASRALDTAHVALIQMTSSKSVEDNLAFLDTHICKAADMGATYILSPENSLIMDLDTQRITDIVRSEAYAQALDHLAGLAIIHRIWLHIGATPVALNGEQLEGEGPQPLLANRSLLIGPDGLVHGAYDKIHMFDVRLPGGETYCESMSFKPGERGVVVDCDFATEGMTRVGMTICYDLRFAGLFRQLAKAGCDIITVPAAFTQFTGKAHWHVLLRARAIETGCFILASAQTGLHQTGRETYGHSLVVAPWGEVLLDAGVETGVFSAQLDLKKIGQARSNVPSLDHDRVFKMSDKFV